MIERDPDRDRKLAAKERESRMRAKLILEFIATMVLLALAGLLSREIFN